MAAIYQNVWAQGDYIYHTTTSGIDVYNSDASALDYHISLPSAATAVWANDNYIYMGTLASGVYRSTASGVAYPYIKEPYLTSNNTMYLHGAGDFLCLTSYAGVDRYDLSTASGTTISGADRIYTIKESIHKCFQTTLGTVYYIENNTFFGLDESPAGLGDYLLNWDYYQHLVFTPTTQDDANVRVIFQFDFPYHHTKLGSGADIRFIDDQGNNLSYYIEEWYPNAIILVKVAVAGTSELYMLYGNSHASAQSNRDATYYLYDDFSTLDSNVWTVYKGSSNSYATIAYGYLKIHDHDNAGISVITNSKIPYGLYINARIRSQGGTLFTQNDAIFGYTAALNKNRPSRGYVQIDPTQSANEKLHYLHAYDTAIQGAQAMLSGWSVWEAVWSLGYQKSIYREETLERTSTNALFSTSNYFSFHIDNSNINPDLNIDWISMETWPQISTHTTTEKFLWPLIQPKLHVVYTPTENWANADHVYEGFYSKPLFLRDIFITEGTSSYNNDNTIFLATDQGAYVIAERQGDEENADQKRYYIS